MAESKRFTWMIESAQSTHLAQEGRQRIVPYEKNGNTRIEKHKSLRIFGLLLKSLIRAHGSFLHRRSHMTVV